MATIIFAQTGVATTTPPPTGSAASGLVLSGQGYETLGGASGNAVLRMIVAAGVVPPAPSYGVGTGALSLSMGYSFNGSPAPPATGSAVINMTAWGFESPNYGRGALNLYSIGYSPDISPSFADPGGAVAWEDVAITSATMTSLQIAMMIANLQLGERNANQFSGLSAITDQVAFHDALYMLYQMLITSNIQMSQVNTITPVAVQKMIDALLLTGLVTNPMQALTTVIDALVMGAMLNPSFRNTITDNAIFSASVAQVYTAVTSWDRARCWRTLRCENYLP